MKILQVLSNFRFSRYFKLLFVVWDVVLLNSAIFLSAWIRYGDLERLFLKEVQTISLLSNLIWITLLLGREAYRLVRIEPLEAILMRTIRKFIFHIAIITFFVVFLNYREISRLRLVYFYAIFFVLLLVSRYLSMKFLKYVRAKGFNFKKFIILGANAAGEKIRKTLSKDLTYGYRFLGFFDEEVVDESFSTSRVKGGFDMVERLVVANAIDEVYVSLPIDKIDVIHKLIKICEKHMVRIKFIPDFQLYTKSSRVNISFYGNTPILSFRTDHLEYTVNR